MATVFAHRLFSASLTSLGCCQELLPHLRLRLARIGGLACLSALASASLAALPAATAAAKPAPSQPAAASATSPLGRLGPLPLDNGYPTPTTAQKLYDELDFQRATQAYLWALPAVGFKALYDAQAKTMGVRNGDVLLYRTLQDATRRWAGAPGNRPSPPISPTGACSMISMPMSRWRHAIG
jgi:hypothetical protein